ncbi:MAG: DUF4123 domain-containing protein [Marinobacter sp.]|uniref:DUF4123 domain-containing protein n=1 Tax=Marinobacter sp. TaxID=50741 RepID=UPI003F98FC79
MKDSTAQSQKARNTTSFYHHSGAFDAEASGYLVDQAKHPEVLRLLFEHDPVPVYDLPYIHSQYREHAYDGPLVIQPTTAESEEWLQRWLAQGSALAVYGPLLTLETIRNHLVSLNTVATPYGDSLFRYADSATLGSLGTSLSPHQRLRILGPLTAIHGCYAGENWTLTKEQPSALQDELKKQPPQPLELTQENLASVEAHRRYLLARALADSNDLEAQTVTYWLQQLETLGAPNEQGLVEGAGVLIARGFIKALSDDELATVRKTRQGADWSDTLEALEALTHSQEGT